MAPNPEPGVEEIERRVIRAADSLLAHDSYLLTCDLNERSITHKFAEHLQREFPEWDVDCEYNRNHDNPKRLDLPHRNDVSNADLHARTVFPDIIIHRRGTDANLVVIEVKKSTNDESDERDMMKLAAFKSQLGYGVALFFRLRTGTTDVGFECVRG